MQRVFNKQSDFIMFDKIERVTKGTEEENVRGEQFKIIQKNIRDGK